MLKCYIAHPKHTSSFKKSFSKPVVKTNTGFKTNIQGKRTAYYSRYDILLFEKNAILSEQK